MSTVCKDCGVQGKGVHHCEQYHNQTHSIAEYQHIEKELQAKVEELTAALKSIISETDEWVCCHDVNQIAKNALSWKVSDE